MNDERRDPPVRVRVTGLQEAQLQTLVATERASAAHRLAAGVPEALVVVRDERDLVGLMRRHDVRVVEADGDPAGYLAWRDEAPGVAIVEALVVEPSYRRYGLGTRLLREVGDKAGILGITHALVLAPRGDSDAASFLFKRGFAPTGWRPDAAELGADLPEAIRNWLDAGNARLVTASLELWMGGTNGLGFIPGLPMPEPTW
ncbi:MAG: GNAT family N-acetyltransferase [Deltaproteobacteria bacterium]|nr:GNAT family N-acetyltransferase [Deltaproteobacteria bacterium]